MLAWALQTMRLGGVALLAWLEAVVMDYNMCKM